MISNMFCDKYFLLSEDDHEHMTKLTSQIIRFPKIKLSLGKQNITVLIDTESKESCWLEQSFQENKQYILKYKELPRTNIQITTAVGSKTRKISRIIMFK